MPRRRGYEPEDRELVRARLDALRPRPGWVPRVPDPPADQVGDPTDPSDRADRAHPIDRADLADPVDPTDRADPAHPIDRADLADTADPAEAGVPWPEESWPAADAWFAGVPGAAPERPPGGRHRAAALADRLPLALRSAAGRSLPEPVRRGRAGLDTGQAVVVLVVAVLAVAGAAVVLWLSRPQVQPAPVPAATVEATGTPVSTPGEAPAGDAAVGPEGEAVPPSGGVVVHVAGRVARAGIVRLPAGSRVADALDAAGGPEAGVDLTPLNLARLLTDGEQVLVGVDPPPGGGAVTGGALPGGQGPDGQAPGASPGDPRLDLNTATAAELEELPGVGPVLAGRIVAWREQNGRFSSTDELREVSGIGPRTFETLAELVRV